MRLNRLQRSRRRNVVGFASDLAAHPEDLDLDDEEDEEERQKEESEILAEISRDADSEGNDLVDDTSKSFISGRGDSSFRSRSVSFIDPDDNTAFGERVQKTGREFDVLMRYLMKHVESHAGGGKSAHVDELETQTFSILNFILEDWDL